MEEYFEFPEFRLTLSEVKKEVVELYSSLVSLYMEMLKYYMDLNVAMNESAGSKDTDIDLHVHALHKMSYLTMRIPDLVDKEHEIFVDNIDLLPYLEEYIKEEAGLKKDLDFNKFCIMDTFIRNEYAPIKNNFVLMRMIRAIKYYKLYQEQYFSMIEQGIGLLDVDSLRDCIPYDYADDETLNTLNVLGAAFEGLPDDSIYNKYQCMFSFVNPSIERFYLNYDFDAVHPYILCNYDKASTKIVKNKIVRTMIAIQKNKLIDQDDNKSVVLHEKLTFSQIMDILFKFNKYNSNYDNRFEELKNDYLDNAMEISLLFAYLQQAYINLTEQDLNDLDHLFSVMIKKENNVKMGSVVLHKKIVDHFFNKEDIFKQKGIQRERKPLNSDKDE